MSETATASAPDRTSSSPTILIVEDEILLRSVIAEHLRDQGFHVIESTNAREAIDVIASKTPVDLVFTDHNMPGAMDGRTLVAWLTHNRPGLPVILTSGSLCPAAGGDAHPRFMMKPYSVEDVERQIRLLLQASRDT